MGFFPMSHDLIDLAHSVGDNSHELRLAHVKTIGDFPIAIANTHTFDPKSLTSATRAVGCRDGSSTLELHTHGELSPGTPGLGKHLLSFGETNIWSVQQESAWIIANVQRLLLKQ